MMVLIRFWRSLTKKYNAKSARYEIKHLFTYTFTPVLGRFFTDSDFWPIWIRIRTQKKNLIRIREKKPDPKLC